MKPTKLISIAASLILAPMLASAQQTPGPVIAHWSFDEDDAGGSLIIKDSGPNHLDGQILAAEGATASIPRVPGIHGKALDFPSNPSAWIELGTPPALDLKPPFTIAAWIKPAATVKYMEILNREWDSVPAGYRFRFMGNRIAFGMGDGTHEMFVMTSAGVPEAGKWAHVAATYDGKHVRLFVNGQALVTEAATLVPSVMFEQKPIKAVLGNFVGTKTAYPFVGLLDEVMIFGKALSADELIALAASQQK